MTADPSLAEQVHPPEEDEGEGTGPDRDERRRLARHRYGVPGVAVAVVLGLLVAFQYALRPAAGRLDLLPKAQPYTELYFPRPTELPQAVVAGRLLRFGFVIGNRQGATTTYHWRVLGKRGTKTVRLGSGSATVGAGRSAGEAVSLRPARLRGVGMIEVRLGAPVETITFHMRRFR